MKLTKNNIMSQYLDGQPNITIIDGLLQLLPERVSSRKTARFTNNVYRVAPGLLRWPKMEMFMDPISKALVRPSLDYDIYNFIDSRASKLINIEPSKVRGKIIRVTVSNYGLKTYRVSIKDFKHSLKMGMKTIESLEVKNPYAVETFKKQIVLAKELKHKTIQLFEEPKWHEMSIDICLTEEEFVYLYESVVSGCDDVYSWMNDPVAAPYRLPNMPKNLQWADISGENKVPIEQQVDVMMASEFLMIA